MFLNAVNGMGFSTAGVLTMQIEPTFVASAVQVRGIDGVVGAPSYAFSNDTPVDRSDEIGQKNVGALEDTYDGYGLIGVMSADLGAQLTNPLGDGVLVVQNLDEVSPVLRGMIRHSCCSESHPA